MTLLIKIYYTNPRESVAHATKKNNQEKLLKKIIMTIESIKKSPLFAGIDDNDQLQAMLGCLTMRQRVYAKDEFILRAGSIADSVGIVLLGGVYVIQEDFWGDRAILAHVGPGGVFGEAFSCTEVQSLPVSVQAAEKSEIMMIDCRKITMVCTSACAFHTRLIRNMLQILAENNILLTRKMEYLSKRTTREKLLSFLSAQAALSNNSRMELPYNRQELADYLCVNRSALSRELSLMQKEGLIRYDKNSFELL